LLGELLQSLYCSPSLFLQAELIPSVAKYNYVNKAAISNFIKCLILKHERWIMFVGKIFNEQCTHSLDYSSAVLSMPFNYVIMPPNHTDSVSDWSVHSYLSGVTRSVYVAVFWVQSYWSTGSVCPFADFTKSWVYSSVASASC
jgi:hypothetical protein